MIHLTCQNCENDEWYVKSNAKQLKIKPEVIECMKCGNEELIRT